MSNSLKYTIALAVHDAADYEDPYEDIVAALNNMGFDITYTIFDYQETNNEQD